MRARPILFNGDMVRAILAGQKTQTRRAIKPRPIEAGFLDAQGQNRPSFDEDGWARVAIATGMHLRASPFGQPGDRLWVREAHAIFPAHGQHRADGERWGPWGGLPTTVSDDRKQIAYYREGFDRCDPGRWRPSIHMPRWACRLVLEITDVRVERLQAISEADALAEGIEEIAGRFTFNGGMHESLTPQHSFQTLWDSTGGQWAANPWVWVVEFKQINEVSNG
ncbi:hypothetical protein [Stenotrophomonas nematodicola]|uniref:hypothetical protein n=1 Tax=Stenotrophomonas nematodicola TaxID=2656746 RepID=UPI0012912DE9|nr:hypothetical protein [Stenotrophomonas nematodicola]